MKKIKQKILRSFGNYLYQVHPAYRGDVANWLTQGSHLSQINVKIGSREYFNQNFTYTTYTIARHEAKINTNLLNNLVGYDLLLAGVGWVRFNNDGGGWIPDNTFSW